MPASTLRTSLRTTAFLSTEVSENRLTTSSLLLRNSRTIGAAVGILTERLRLPADVAMDRLRELSQHDNRKLADLAAELVETGTLPGMDEEPFGDLRRS